MQVDADAPVLLGIDEEGGEVQRLPWDGAAGAEQLRAEAPPAAQAAFAVPCRRRCPTWAST